MRRMWRTAGLAATIGLTLVVPGLSAESGLGHWSSRAPLPEGRVEVGGTAVGGALYVVGGQTETDGHAPLLEAYDPRTNTWHARAPMPEGLSHPGVTTLGGKLYVFGGFLKPVHLQAQDAAFVYDPKTDRWSALPKMPTPRGSVVAAAVDGKIHVFGGRGPDLATVAEHDVFDPKSGRWSTAAPLPFARDHAGIAVLGGKIHVFGGRTKGVTENLTAHDVYDPRTDTWSKAAPLPTARSSGAYTVLDGRILYAGGECKLTGGARQTFDDVTAYDPKTDRWTTLAPLPHGRHAFAAGTIGPVAYFAAGSPACGDSYSADLLAFTFH